MIVIPVLFMCVFMWCVPIVIGPPELTAPGVRRLGAFLYRYCPYMKIELG